jgi:hypothetical protein
MNEDWVIECIDCPKQFSEMTDRNLRLDAAGNPHIAYGEDHLYYAWHDGIAWNYETVDTSPDVGRFASLVLDEVGNPHISYFVGIDHWRNNLKYIHKQDGAWQTYTVDSQHGGSNDIAFDFFDRLHISYHDAVNQDLRYAISPTQPYQVIVRPSNSWGYAQPGSTITHTLEVINAGQQIDSYEVTVAANLWLAETDKHVGPISFQESATLDIKVTVPPTVTYGTADNAMITIRSQGDPDINASATLTTYAAITTNLPLVQK